MVPMVVHSTETSPSRTLKRTNYAQTTKKNAVDQDLVSGGAVSMQNKWGGGLILMNVVAPHYAEFFWEQYCRQNQRRRYGALWDGKKRLGILKEKLGLGVKKSLHEPRSQKGATSESKPMNMYLKTRVARTGTWRNIARLPRKRTRRFRKRRLQEKLMELCVLWQSYGQEKWKSKQKENTNKCKIG